LSKDLSCYRKWKRIEQKVSETNADDGLIFHPMKSCSVKEEPRKSFLVLCRIQFINTKIAKKVVGFYGDNTNSDVELRRGKSNDISKLKE
jgi:hypothetical protein